MEAATIPLLLELAILSRKNQLQNSWKRWSTSETWAEVHSSGAVRRPDEIKLFIGQQPALSDAALDKARKIFYKMSTKNPFTWKDIVPKIKRKAPEWRKTLRDVAERDKIDLSMIDEWPTFNTDIKNTR